MSINPVTEIKPIGTERAGPQVRTSQHASSQLVGATSPDSGFRPKQQPSDTSPGIRSPEMPVDEVQVQQDSQTHGRIVIRYLDHSGDVILQVPSSQILGLAHAIEQALEQQAKSRMRNVIGRDALEGGSNGH